MKDYKKIMECVKKGGTINLTALMESLNAELKRFIVKRTGWRK